MFEEQQAICYGFGQGYVWVGEEVGRVGRPYSSEWNSLLSPRQQESQILFLRRECHDWIVTFKTPL